MSLLIVILKSYLVVIAFVVVLSCSEKTRQQRKGKVLKKSLFHKVSKSNQLEF